MNRSSALAILLFAALPAARAATFTVTTTADSGAGSLRQAVADAGALAGADTIVFAPALGGQAITLSSGALSTADADGVTIDATALAAGLAIRGNGADRLFLNTGILTLRGLALTGGYTGACCGGGAIYSNVSVTVENCSIAGNVSGFGGALFNDGVATITGSTFSGNRGGTGIAIYNRGAALTLRNSTVAMNSAAQNHAIYNDGSMTLLHATVAANGAAGGQGGLYNAASRTLTLQYSLIGGGNAGTTDLTNAGTVTLTGTNFAEKAIVNAGGTVGGAGTMAIGNPLLRPLGQLDGATPSLYPRPGSPLIDAATGSTETVDQLGRPRPLDGDVNGAAVADIGAVEADPLLVTSLADGGPGTLREAIIFANTLAGPDTVRFARPLGGRTIYLTSSELSVNDTGGLTIDADSVPGGITLHGNDARRLISVSYSTLGLRGLTLTHGYNTSGGGLYAYGSNVTLDRCAIFYNLADEGGGLFVTNSDLLITNTLIHGNKATAFGGGLYFLVGGSPATATIHHSTIADNIGQLSAGGVAVRGPLTLRDSIVAGNGADLLVYAGNTLALEGASVVQGIVNNGTVTGSGTVINADPLLGGALPSGGQTFSRYPLGGSPAIDAATGSTEPIDQRGALRPFDGDGNGSALRDIGSVEAGGCASPGAPVEGLTLAKGALPGAVHFSFQDPNTGVASTGARVRRAGSPAPPAVAWPILGENVQDEDGGTPDVQWTDDSGTVPAGIWFYLVAAENAGCGFEGPQ